eukprot:766639-Hanusia_phi.AAC.7
MLEAEEGIVKSCSFPAPRRPDDLQPLPTAKIINRPCWIKMHGRKKRKGRKRRWCGEIYSRRILEGRGIRSSKKSPQALGFHAKLLCPGPRNLREIASRVAEFNTLQPDLTR